MVVRVRVGGGRVVVEGGAARVYVAGSGVYCRNGRRVDGAAGRLVGGSCVAYGSGVVAWYRLLAYVRAVAGGDMLELYVGDMLAGSGRIVEWANPLFLPLAPLLGQEAEEATGV